jgi:hypothetical protein
MAAGPAMEMWSRQSGTAESPDGRQRIITMQRAFTVTLSANDPLETVYTAAGLPLVGHLYPGAFGVDCKSLQPQRASPIMAIVTANYSGEIGLSDASSSPIDLPHSIEWGGSTTDEAIDEDWDGKPIVTANGEPIEGLTERLTDDVVTIERAYLTVNRYALRAYRRATNSDTFLGWPPGTARMIDDVARAVFVGGVIKYWHVRAVIQFREPFRTTPDKAWYKRVRHEGILVRDSAAEKPHIAWDEKTKTPVTKPVLLKADGTRETNPNNAHWLEFKTLGSLPFNALGLI